MSTATSIPGNQFNRRNRTLPKIASPPSSLPSGMLPSSIPSLPPGTTDSVEASPPSEDDLQFAREAIAQCSHLDAARITLEGSRKQIILRGEVHSFFQKQLAQEVMLQLADVGEVHNTLRVQTEAKRMPLTGPCAVRHF